MRHRAAGDSGALRILFLDSWLRDRSLGSGSAVAIAGLADGLQSLGHEVEILRPERSLSSLDLTRLSFNVSLSRRLAGREADLVVGFDFDGGLLPPGTIASPYAVALKGVMADEARFETGRDRRRILGLSRIEARNARSASTVVCTSEYSAGQAIRLYGLREDRLRVVPEGIHTARWSGLAGRASATRSGKEGGPVILSVARQYRRKNTGSLLRAFARLREGYPRSELRIVGDGPELPALRTLAADLGIREAVEFTGSLTGLDALQAEYAAADIFCLPSLQEGFGIVFLEAMAAGLPIVAARAGAVPEVAPEGEVSLLVEPSDDDDLLAALRRLAGSPELRRRLGSCGTARWPAFDWSAVSAAFLAAALSGLGPADRRGSVVGA